MTDYQLFRRGFKRVELNGFTPIPPNQQPLITLVIVVILMIVVYLQDLT